MDELSSAQAKLLDIAFEALNAITDEVALNNDKTLNKKLWNAFEAVTEARDFVHGGYQEEEESGEDAWNNIQGD